MKSTKQQYLCTVFRDPLYGYIHIPRFLCELFIDTPIFQRLRNVEQTSMRCLFPTAHHDRFSHSLGVFFLASKAIEYLIDVTTQKEWKSILAAQAPYFLIAALMHDCGHAPFSHICESFYAHAELDNELDQLIDTDLQNDLRKRSPGIHEKVSSVVLLRGFSEKIAEALHHFSYADDDSSLHNPMMLIPRMIMGISYSEPDNQEKQIANCLISLLNGKSIDVDKLDYIMRDTWASGTSNVRIDIERILSSLFLDKPPDRPGIRLVFHKSSLSCIDSVIQGRNYLYKWLYSHHKVVYFNDILEKTIKNLGLVCRSQTEEPNGDFLLTLFSIKAFFSPLSYADEVFFLPADCDVRYLIKKYRNDIETADEILYRQTKFVPLWKTQEEYNYHFQDIGEDKKIYLFSNPDHLHNALSHVIKVDTYLRQIYAIPAKHKLTRIQKDDILIGIREDVVQYNKIYRKKTLVHDEIEPFWYVFIPQECSKLRIDCIKALLNSSYLV